MVNPIISSHPQKVLVLTLAFVACTLADVSELGDQGYDYPQPAAPANAYIPPPAPKNTYIPPAQDPIEEIDQPAQDGYRYKTVRRRVVRLRN